MHKVITHYLIYAYAAHILNNMALVCSTRQNIPYMTAAVMELVHHLEQEFVQ